MTLENINELLESPGLAPKPDTFRIQAIRQNRRLLHGDFTSLGSEHPVHWPRRIASFFGEFLYATPPEIRVKNNPRLEEFISEISDSLFAEIIDANKNMIATGQGVLATHPRDPLVFESFPPEHWFTICDVAGDPVEDVLIRLRGEAVENQKLDLYRYPVQGDASWSIHKYQGGKIGEKLAEIPIPSRAGRQIATLDLGEGSLFDVLKPSLTELSKILGGLSDAVRKTLHPHLSGPSGALRESDDGERVDLDTRGQYLPREADDVPFEYVVWDKDTPAAEFAYREHQTNLLVFASLSPLIFNPNLQASGNLSGRSLLRLTTPLISRLGRLARENAQTIKRIIAIMNQNRRHLGMEYFSYRNQDIEIEWKYLDVFQDIGVKPDREPTEFEREVE